jgi:hypothetical protein
MQGIAESVTSCARHEIEEIDVALVGGIGLQVHLDLTDDGIPIPHVDVPSWMPRDAVGKPLEIGFSSTEGVIGAEATNVGIAPKVHRSVGIARKFNRAESERL